MPHVRHEAHRIDLPNGHLAYLEFLKQDGRVADFAVQVVRIIGDEVFEVYRADTAHGHPHEHTWSSGLERVRTLRYTHRIAVDYTAVLSRAWEKAKEIAHADDPTKRAKRPGIPAEDP